MKIPLLIAQFEVYLNGNATPIPGIATVTMPNFEALMETIKGAGIMGELPVPVRGQFSALNFELAFRVLYGTIDDVAVTETINFDLRSAVESEDQTTYQREHGKERFSIIGVVSKVDYGKRESAATTDALIGVAPRRVERFIDGKQVLLYDPLNYKYIVNGKDIYAPVREALT